MKKTMVISRLQCTNCGQEFPIPRYSSKRRKGGHVKTLWCVICERRTRHIEQEPTKYN